MPIPSEMNTRAYLRVIRRWTIAVAVFYACALLAFVLAATLQPPLPIEGHLRAAMAQTN